MWDFLTFRTFITPDILIFFYYVGAVVIPIVMLQSRKYLVEKVPLFQTAKNMSQTFLNTLNTKEKTVVIISFIIMFLVMEMMWRMVFEAMIGYFHMHEYLQVLSSNPTR